MAIVTWVQSNWAIVFGVLFGISESLALIPAVKANSVFQFIFGFLAKFKKN